MTTSASNSRTALASSWASIATIPCGHARVKTSVEARGIAATKTVAGAGVSDHSEKSTVAENLARSVRPRGKDDFSSPSPCKI